MRPRSLYLGAVILIHSRSGLSDLNVFQRRPSSGLEVTSNMHGRHMPSAGHIVSRSHRESSRNRHFMLLSSQFFRVLL